MDTALLIVGLVLLIGAGDSLVRGAVAMSLRLDVPAVIIGATVVGFGTSAPELLVSVEAAIVNAPGIALGNVVGSNIANVLLVLGLPALIAPLGGCGEDARRNLYIMLGATAVFIALALTGSISFAGGLVLTAICFGMVWDSARVGNRARNAAAETRVLGDIAEIEDVDPRMPTMRIATLIAVGVVGLPIGAHLLIEGARGIAHDLGVSEALIGLTVVAVGTSLPELATSVMAALRREPDVAIGNVIGSNIFNLTAIIGIAAMVRPLRVPAEIFSRDLWVMLATTVLVAPIVFWCRGLGRISGALFLTAYVGYVWYAFTG